MTGADISFRLNAATRRAGFTLVGVICLLMGLGFLTAAGWFVLSELRDSIFAALVIGGAYTGIALVCFALASRRGHATHPQAAGSLQAMLPLLVEAFAAGAAAGRTTARGHR